METVKQGRVEYKVSIIVPDGAPEIPQYSKELWLKILHGNISESKEVFFNGNFSRTNSIDTEYGYKSSNFILRKKGAEKYRYGKEFPTFKFYLSFTEPEIISDKDFQTEIELLNEYKEIAGYTCRKAKIETANKTFIIYFTDAFKVDDPTDAVLQHEGINGFILQQDEIPVAKDIYYYLRYTVSTFDFETLLHESVFDIPEGYKFFRNIDEVRKADRAIMKKNLEEAEQHSLSDEQKKVFNGYWLLQGAADKIVVHIEYTGSLQKWNNTYTFSTLNFTIKDAVSPKTVTDQASLWQNLLLVEDPPDYRLYAYNAVADEIELKGSEVFIFKRINKDDVDLLY